MMRNCLGAVAAICAVAAPMTAAQAASPAGTELVPVPESLPGSAQLPPPSREELEANGKGALRVVGAAVKAYSKVGWELGRLTSKHDPGPYPGLVKAVGPAVKKVIKKGR